MAGGRMTPRSFVGYQCQDGIAEIMLDRPESSNAIDLATAAQLTEAVQRAGGDASVAAVLLRGNGPRFCGGGDLAAMASAPDRPAFVAQLAEAAHDVVRALDSVGKPVVVAVQGAAAGVGLSLVLGADIVVAGASATFVTAYTSVGLTPDGGLSWRLPRVVGQRRAMQMILLSEPVGAGVARDLGIVSEVCPDDDVARRARETAAALAARPAHALAESRRLVRLAWGRGLDEHLDDEAATIARMAATDATGREIDRFLGRVH